MVVVVVVVLVVLVVLVEGSGRSPFVDTFEPNEKQAKQMKGAPLGTR